MVPKKISGLSSKAWNDHAVYYYRWDRRGAVTAAGSIRPIGQGQTGWSGSHAEP